MKDYVILTINPGSSSTKCGLVKGNQVLMDKTVDHDRSEFADCKTFADQEPKRMALIQEALKESGIDLSTVDAVVGRGVGLYACEGGTYEIDDLAYDHATRDVAGIHHPATLGIKIAYKFGQMLGKPAFFVNPMPIDEMCDEARMTGIKGCYRPARSHPLNQKQVAIHHSELTGRKCEDSNYIILHLGGGIFPRMEHGAAVADIYNHHGNVLCGRHDRGILCQKDKIQMVCGARSGPDAGRLSAHFCDQFAGDALYRFWCILRYGRGTGL